MKWGFVGFGRIARKFLLSLQERPEQSLCAIASRSNAEALKKEFPQAAVYDNYEELYHDPDVEVVYISTTHNFHRKNTLDALSNSKHVLCEKPIGVNAGEVLEMTQKAKEKDLFLLEAIWSRYLPGYQKAVESIKSGVIGEVRMVHSEFAFTDRAGKKRLYDPKLAGGANYDINIYNLALIMDLYDEQPIEINSRVKLSEDGVDLTVGSIFEFRGNRFAQTFSSLELDCMNSALIYGSEGWVRMEKFWQCERFHIHTANGDQTLEFPFESTGYCHEIDEVVHCVENGLGESPRLTHHQSIEIARLSDSVFNSF